SGHEASFWNDTWAPTALPLINYVTNPLPRVLVEFNASFGNSVNCVCSLMRDCASVKELWLSLGVGIGSDFFNEQNWLQWLCKNLISVAVVMNGNWSLNFGVILDILWWRRNELIFNNNFNDSAKLNDKVTAAVSAIVKSFDLMSSINKQQGNGNSMEGISWRAPERDWVALNTDGSVVELGSNAACGGILRDSNGCFL
ncbi:ribonuclease H, partial [Trifolium medium]|nr:ribonuclease H [Trifolium medium]